jgi:hypothetical protein
MYMLQFQGRTPSRSLLILTCDSRSFYPNRLPPVYGHVWGKWVQTKDVFTIACVYMHIHAHRSKTFDLRVRVGVISWSKTCHTSGAYRHNARVPERRWRPDRPLLSAVYLYAGWLLWTQCTILTLLPKTRSNKARCLPQIDQGTLQIRWIWLWWDELINMTYTLPFTKEQ